MDHRIDIKMRTTKNGILSTSEDLNLMTVERLHQADMSMVLFSEKVDDDARDILS